MRRLKAISFIAVVMTLIAAGGSAFAADKIRVGKPEAKPYQFAPVEVGVEVGTFAKFGIEAVSVAFGGASRMHQAMTSNDIDIALGSGPEMALVAKGVPEMSVAAMYGPPNGLCVIVLPTSSIRTATDLKGRTMGISSPSGLTAWAAKEIGRHEGWGPEGVKAISLGSQDGIVGGMLAGNVDSAVTATEYALTLQNKGRVRIVANLGEFVPDFLGHVIFASNELIAKNPDALRRFLKGWFATIAYMQANKAETVRITAQVSDLTPEVATQAYDEQIRFFSTDGKFEPKALKVVEGTFVELGFIDKPVDIKTLYTEAYLPK